METNTNYMQTVIPYWPEFNYQEHRTEENETKFIHFKFDTIVRVLCEDGKFREVICHKDYKVIIQELISDTLLLMDIMKEFNIECYRIAMLYDATNLIESNPSGSHNQVSESERMRNNLIQWKE